MSQWARVVTFEADDDAVNALVNEISSHDGPPEGVPAKRITVLRNKAANQLVVAVRFDSEADLKQGGAALEKMDPPEGGNIRRVSVDEFEVLAERQAP